MKRFATLFVAISTCLIAFSQPLALNTAQDMPTAHTDHKQQAPTAGWIDVTDAYIVNPRFDDNTKGWDIECDVANTRVVYGGLEFWSGWFKISQDVSLPNGKYRLSLQAYYRTADDNTAFQAHANGYEELTAIIYANDNDVPVVSVYSDHLDEDGPGGFYMAMDKDYNFCYYPASVDAGAHCFELGMYNNTLEVKVTDGTLSFGIYCWQYLSGNWCMMDNFKLEYYGSINPVESISISPSKLALNAGESATLTAKVSPSDATFRNVNWSSSNPRVAEVDATGKVTAYQNGTATIYAHAQDESGVSATCAVTVSSVAPTADNIVINEIQSANIDMFVDPSFNYGSWVELYNPTSKAVSLNYLYVSDDADNLTKYNLGKSRGSIPAKGYHVLWFDHYNLQFPSQINFKLDYDGGTIYISDSEGNLITSQDYPAAYPRTSYARTTDGGNEWGYTASPTPKKSNASSTFADERVEAPIVDKDACLFTTPFSFSVEIPKGATLYYTTDGTTPTLTNGAISHDGRFQVSTTSTYRFRLFEEGKLPSQVVTRSFLYADKDYMLPIISVVTDPVNIYDDSLGVYVRGVNGRPGNGQSTPCNWNMDWDRPVNFEYITPEEGMVINQEVDFAMCGGWSRAFTPHSFKLKAGKIYEGLNSIDYPFFADKPYLKHKTLQIRNGGNDTSCRIKDAAMQTIIRTSGLDVEGQAVQPVMHFINGEYKGMLNMREPNNKHYAYANWGIDTDELDQFEMSPDSGYVQMEGTRDAFLKWYELSKNAADEATYEEIRRLVDIDEYINYMAVEMYIGSVDWPQNNIKGFRPRTEDGRFRFVLFDLDSSLGTTNPFSGFESRQTWTFDYLYDTGNRFTEEIELVTIFLGMLDNDSFRKQFIDTYCLVAGSVFEPERCHAIVDEMAARIAPALAYEGESPYSTANSIKSGLTSRQGTMINALINYWRMGLSYDMKQSVSVASNIDGAMLRLNDMAIPTNKFNGALFAPITLQAEPKAGYRFVGWGSKGATTAIPLISSEATWEYYDQGSLDGESWTSPSYLTSAWSEGKAPLGYYTSDTDNSRGYNTILDYGSDASNKRTTYYFRHAFTLNNAPAADDIFCFNYAVDDGMVIYVNGVEAERYLMPDGAVSYSTYASTYAYSNPDQGTLYLDASLFKKGKNIIAIEVHNNNSTSSDIYFSGELTYAGQSSSEYNIVCTDMEYALPAGDHTLMALYEPLTDAELTEQNFRPVRINEVSADNSIYINEYYKKNDWIELVNTTSEPVDVAGMYLSDNVNKPTKYMISGDGNASTTIAPYGHLIIWADKLTQLTQLHAPFKLAAEGGHLMLTSADQTWSDVLYYEPHLGTESVGLYPDGGNDVYVMTTPTIGKANTLSSYAAWLEQPGTGTGIETVLADDELLRLEYHEHMLHIFSAEGTWADVTIYAATGRVCARSTAALHAGYAAVPVATLDEGIYIISVTDSRGETQTLKVSVN